MTTYQKAIKALEECVKDAMENDVDPGLQMEIWRHYQGMKSIQRQLPVETKLSFSLDGIDRVMENYDTSLQGNDVITFS